MLKKEVPNELFVVTIQEGFQKEKARGNDKVYASHVWDHIVIKCMTTPGGFDKMFAWRMSTAKNQNAVKDIMDAVERGHVPGLKLVDKCFVMEV